MKKIKFVKQEDRKGCVAACLAMITGKTYKQVTGDFENDFSADGLTSDDMISYLSDHGYSVIKKSVETTTHKDFAREELLRPFAPMHILTVQWYAEGRYTHVVVMDADGKIYDPYETPEEEVRTAYQIIEIFGIYQ